MKVSEVIKITSESEAINAAIDWQTWQQDKSLSYDDLLDWQACFEVLGKRFNLTDEFKENGII